MTLSGPPLHSGFFEDVVQVKLYRNEVPEGELDGGEVEDMADSPMSSRLHGMIAANSEDSVQ